MWRVQGQDAAHGVVPSGTRCGRRQPTGTEYGTPLTVTARSGAFATVPWATTPSGPETSALDRRPRRLVVHEATLAWLADVLLFPAWRSRVRRSASAAGVGAGALWFRGGFRAGCRTGSGGASLVAAMPVTPAETPVLLRPPERRGRRGASLPLAIAAPGEPQPEEKHEDCGRSRGGRTSLRGATCSRGIVVAVGAVDVLPFAQQPVGGHEGTSLSGCRQHLDGRRTCGDRNGAVAHGRFSSRSVFARSAHRRNGMPEKGPDMRTGRGRNLTGGSQAAASTAVPGHARPGPQGMDQCGGAAGA